MTYRRFQSLLLGLSLSLVVAMIGCGVSPYSGKISPNLNDQSIAFGALAGQTLGTIVTLTATASSNLPVVFASATLGTCTVAGSNATLFALGTCTILANQPGNASYSPASEVSQSFSVNPSSTLSGGSLAYSTNPAVYTVGIPILSNTPLLGNANVPYSFAVSPALPQGLILDTTSGVITGTPIATAATSSYTVSATNSSQSITTTLSITAEFPVATPDQYGFPVPSPEPALPANFDVFTPPLYSANPAAPAVAEWTRTANSGNAIELSLDNLTADTTFFVYGPNSNAAPTPLNVAPAVLDYALHGSASGQIASIVLPSVSGTPSGMFLVWPENSVGMSAPVAINRTEAWWLGPRSAVEGTTVSVFGRNLTYPGTYAVGPISPLVYLVGATGSSQTYLPAVSAANPYKVDFSVSNVNPGTYDVWIHNGAGGHFGWSGPLSLTVSASSPWNCQTSDSSTFSVMSYGATGNGISDDTRAVTGAISAAGVYAANSSHPYATVYFPAGTYMVSTGFHPPSNVCFAGDGTANWQTQSGRNGSASILRLSGSTATCASPPSSPVQARGAFIWANEGNGGSNNVEFTNLVLDANGNIPCVNETQGTHIRFRSSTNVKFDSIVLNGTGPTIWGGGFTSIDFSNGVNYYLTNSTIIGTGVYNGNTRQIFMSGNLFLAADNSSGMMVNFGTTQTAFWNNTQEDLQYYNTANPATPIPYSQGSASYIAAIAGQSLIGTGLGPYGKGRIGGSEVYETGLIYIGGNDNINAGPCDPTNTEGAYPDSYPGCASGTDPNSGEQILFETPSVDYGGLATESTATTVAVSGLTETSCGYASTNCIGEDAIIVGGTGLGQNRHIIAQDGSTVTVSAPWLVNPDSTSTIYVGNVTYQVAVYNNIEQGKADQSSRYTALAGVETWSNVYSLVYDSNQVSNVRTGIFDASLSTANGRGNWIVPNYFNLFTNNTITSSNKGVIVADAFFGNAGDPQAVASIGNVFRNNIFGTSNSNVSLNTGLYLTGVELAPTAALPGEGNALQGLILDGNSFVVDTHGAAALAAASDNSVPAGLWTDSGNALIIDTLFRNNSFLLTAGTSSTLTGTSYGMVFGSDASDPSAPAAATPGDTCIESGVNMITGFATPTFGLTCM